MSIIDVSNLTKDYGHGRGVFDVAISVEKGECYGFLGPNGAGKTTTIRHLMGFSKPQKGSTSIMGRDSWKNSAMLQKMIGYLPGEIALPQGITGTGFLNMMKRMRGLGDDSYLKMLLEKFELDPNIGTKQMSLGVKRKLAVVTAFMHDPDILILDEPTSGLDPIMQQIFIDYIEDEKKRGKTIFLSSHIFHEVDATCDKIAIIKDGRVISKFVANDLKNKSDKVYRVTFKTIEDYRKFEKLPYQFASKNPDKLRLRVHVLDDDVNQLITDISNLGIADFHEFPTTLEDYFMKFYKEDRVFEGVK
ncbi:ABC transporter ATP-binding protein [Blautia liquoris]|jgi:ABC-2 type transport system ATP-binding protein|uniref:ABC transporter ATP-binding protein n=1 Tax=Blautia liquoris TaxID=2779518 RepID=A0A7M2RJF6_9FIRM|nr:ABC transporter ATP-binding protein [Blautia liquoris]QOV20389.1 ABC transporter ATP-binding protein [Blautia liquoris]